MVIVSALAELSFEIAIDRPWLKVRHGFFDIYHISARKDEESAAGSDSCNELSFDIAIDRPCLKFDGAF
jgi:hypothetical protein